MSPRVAVYWESPPQAPPTGDAAAGWPLAIPAAGPDRFPALVAIRLPDGLGARPASAEMEITAADRLVLDRADRIVRQVNEFITQMDRGSGRDREKVASLLIAHELNLRTAERSLRWSSRHLSADRRDRAERDLAVIDSARKAMIENLRAAALDDEIAAAHSYLGLAAATPVTIPVAEPAVGDRIRGLGRPTFLMGMAPGIGEVPATVTLGDAEQPVASEAETADRARSMLMLGILAAIGLAAVLRARPGAWGLFILGALLGLLAFVGGPTPTAVGVVAVIAGRLFRTGSAGEPPAPAELSSFRPFVPGAG
jgi:hypothetical protein